jgi:hypothetical protein
MIDFQRALNERRLLQALFENTYGFALVSGLVADAAETLSLPLADALEMAEALRARGLLTLAVSENPREIRAWLTDRGIAYVERGEGRGRTRRHG